MQVKEPGRLGTISAVPTCTANMHMRATRRKYRVSGISSLFLWEKNVANSVYFCVLTAHLSPVECSETIFPPEGFTH